MAESGAKIIDLQAFKTRKALSGERRNGVQQAFRPEVPQGPAGRVPPNPGTELDLSQRIERIKASIMRINQLMAELRSSNPETKKP